MRAFSRYEHLAALAVALLLVLGLRLQDRVWHSLAAWQGGQQAVRYTPYFPGLNRIEQHEIFAPENRALRKVVFLGASAVHSVGCDYTWIPPAQAIREPANVHHSCSVAAQFNEELARRGITGWKAFNLAKAGGRLAPMSYVYAKLLPLKPDIVVYGDSFPYYMETNAGAENLLREDYEQLDRLFLAHPATAAPWQGFRQRLAQGGLSTDGLPSPRNIGKSFMRLPPQGSPSAVAAHWLALPRNRYSELEHPQPLRFATWRRWESRHTRQPVFENPDPGFGYFQALEAMSQMQKLNGGKLFFYYSPQFDRRGDTVYTEGLDRAFGGYLRDHGIAHVSLVEMPLQLLRETYDGDHQTVLGNRKIAAGVLDAMVQQGLIR